ncbi:MAG: methyltransferase type 12 [Stappia sp.]|uniref:class I SAM-dependent methyltransferase n=1 Tax=Stappia sp. TaxID=1870903 RepID=UPI000C653C05|nr:class I SAM-dependent methyltransferase [Stappia sp.]MAA98784.1 methyltransferase type 12 [Stappia sp.]MBM21445.1 methyltransferase type 12 [Stappia sp.]
MTVFPDHAAEDYDERIARLVPGYGLAIGLMAHVLAARRPRPARVLVAGCGTGAEILAGAALLADTRFTAVEPSAGMLETARRKARAEGVEGRIDFHRDMLENTPEAPHDAAMLSLVLHFLPDDGAKRDLLRAIAARLRTGGQLLLVDALAPQEDDAPLRDWLQGRGHAPAAAEAVVGRMRETWHRIPRDRLVRLLEDAGFRVTAPFFQAFDYLGLEARRT